MKVDEWESTVFNYKINPEIFTYYFVNLNPNLVYQIIEQKNTWKWIL